MNNVEVYNYNRNYSLLIINAETKEINLGCQSQLAIIDTKNTNKFKMKLIRFILKLKLPKFIRLFNNNKNITKEGSTFKVVDVDD